MQVQKKYPHRVQKTHKQVPHIFCDPVNKNKVRSKKHVQVQKKVPRSKKHASHLILGTGILWPFFGYPAGCCPHSGEHAYVKGWIGLTNTTGGHHVLTVGWLQKGWLVTLDWRDCYGLLHPYSYPFNMANLRHPAENEILIWLISRLSHWYRESDCISTQNTATPGRIGGEAGNSDAYKDCALNSCERTTMN